MSFRRTRTLLLLPLTLLLPMDQAFAFKCWTNSEGIRECGNLIPPEYAQQESRTYNERGMTTEVQERAKTAEELEAERAVQEGERQRLAEEQQRKEKQAAIDRVLLMTYSSERDITASRDRKLTAIQGTIDITRGTIEVLNKRLAMKKGQAANLERSGKPVTEALTGEMESINRQISEKRLYIQEKEQQMAVIRDKGEADLKRFRELAHP